MGPQQVNEYIRVLSKLLKRISHKGIISAEEESILDQLLKKLCKISDDQSEMGG